MPEPNTITMSRDAKDIIEMIKTLDLPALQDLQSMLIANPIQDIIRCKQYKMPNVKTGDLVFSIAIPGMTEVLDADNDYITIMWLGHKQLFTRDGLIYANGEAKKDSARMIWHNSEEFMIAAAENSYKKESK